MRLVSLAVIVTFWFVQVVGISSAFAVWPQTLVGIMSPQSLRGASFIARPTTATLTPLFVLAEPPMEEKSEKKRKKISNIFLNNNKKKNKPLRIETIEEYKSVVADEKEKIVAVRFYSPICRTCKAAEKYFYKLCRDNPDVKFVELPTTKNNGYLHEGLGVKTFPFGHIYHPEAGLVEELSINKKVFGQYERALRYYIDGQGDVEYPQDDDEEGLCQPAGCRIDYD